MTDWYLICCGPTRYMENWKNENCHAFAMMESWTLYCTNSRWFFSAVRSFDYWSGLKKIRNFIKTVFILSGVSVAAPVSALFWYSMSGNCFYNPKFQCLMLHIKRSRLHLGVRGVRWIFAMVPGLWPAAARPQPPPSSVVRRHSARAHRE